MSAGRLKTSARTPCITEMLESGMPSKFVKDLAGHRSLSMTERYLHVSDARRILQANRVRF